MLRGCTASRVLGKQPVCNSSHLDVFHGAIQSPIKAKDDTERWQAVAGD